MAKNLESNGTVAALAQGADDRVISVDVLRGFDMLWIVGGSSVIMSLEKLGDNPVVLFLKGQLTHCEWEGCVFYDLIFPLFLFLVGLSVVLSMGRIMAREGAAAAHRRIFKRFAIMFVLGVFYSGGIRDGLEGMRLMGVLQRLALGYLFTSLMFIHLKPKQMMMVCAGLLLGYWAWLSFVPVPGLGRTSFARGENWANYIDSRFLPFHALEGTWDPEGILSTLPAIATCLLGAFAGMFLKDSKVPASKKGLYFVGAGVVALALGYLWGFQFPIIKRIWTSSYVLVAGGYSCIMLGVFYQVIDVWKWRAWTAPFLWIGSNALAVYLVRNMVDFRLIAERITGGTDVQAALGPLGVIVATCVNLLLVIWFARFLYQKKIFIKI